MYNTFSDDYDRFVNWQGRLAYEMPFIEQQVKHLMGSLHRSLDILDSACGTGMHAIALAKAGHQVSAADLFPQMIEKSQQNALATGVQVNFKTAGFGKMETTFGSNRFDLLLCLGNSLPHILDDQALFSALMDFAAVLRPGGKLMIQNRNFDAVIRDQARWMEPQTHRNAEEEWIFQRFYDFLPNGLIRFNIVTLKRREESEWESHVASTLLKPQLSNEMVPVLSQAGFEDIQIFGSMQGEEFSPESSGNLIITAIKA